MRTDRVSPPTEQYKVEMHTIFKDHVNTPKGRVFIELVSDSGEVLGTRDMDNLITLDAGILSAMQDSDRSPSRGLYMLAVGSGATGSLLSPDLPDNRQRKLNTEVARKAFASVSYRDNTGSVSAIPTNVVDFAVQFGSSEAVAPLNEMGLISPVSTNPSILNPNPDSFPDRDLSVDLTNYDILFNYLTFPVLSKPSGATLRITWRITF